MHFDFVDRVLELSPVRIVTLRRVSDGDDFLEDHFATFPVMPGVLMLEMLVQSARRLAESRPEYDHVGPPLVLGKVRALKYGRFVKPGASLRCEVELARGPEDGVWEFKGEGLIIEPEANSEPPPPPPTAVSGRFSLRPVRTAAVVRAD
jgi:3-hydroxyacyl-[acyl-carrier-protein] dehydratase